MSKNAAPESPAVTPAKPASDPPGGGAWRTLPDGTLEQISGTLPATGRIPRDDVRINPNLAAARAASKE